ncbi:hypothetical protein LPYR103PRE_05520 [Segatella asaccharophila]
MTIEDLRNAVFEEYESKSSKDKTRYNALNRVLNFVTENGGVDCILILPHFGRYFIFV